MGKTYKFNDEEIKGIIKDYAINFIPVMNIAKSFSVDSSVIKRILNENEIKVVNGSAFSKKYWIERGLSENDASVKVLQMKPCCVEYWMCKGFSTEDSKLQVELHLMNTKRAFIIKYGDRGIELYNNQKLKTGAINSKRSKKYWIKRGSSEEEAINNVTEIQKTYSKEIWINKFGEEDGIKKLKDRNSKWQNSLKLRKDYDDIQKRKDVRSIDHYLNKYGDEYIDEFIERQTNFDDIIKKELIFLLKEKNYNGFLELIKKTFQYSGRKINNISKSKIFQFVFDKSKDNLKNDLIKQYPIKNKNSYGTTYMIDGVILRSLGEVTIYNFLNSKNVKFKYDKEYPKQTNKKYKYDFYLVDDDIYIEYMGMENIRRTEKTVKMHDDYDSRIRIKRKHCVENNLKHYFSNSVENIIEFINNLYV